MSETVNIDGTEKTAELTQDDVKKLVKMGDSENVVSKPKDMPLKDWSEQLAEGFKAGIFMKVDIAGVMLTPPVRLFKKMFPNLFV